MKGGARRPLLLSDIISTGQDGQELKNVTYQIYHNDIRVIWPPQWNGMDELDFTLENGNTVDVFIFGDTTTTENGDEMFNDMTIDVPEPVNLVKESRYEKLRGMGGRSRKHKKTKRTKRRKSRNEY